MAKRPIPESTHWYDENGNAVFSVPSADGKSTIEPTLREARKFGLLPGATAINKQISSPFLEAWKEENAVKTAYRSPAKQGEDLDEYVRRILWEAGKIGRDAAEAGKIIHKDIEEFFLDSKYPVQGSSQRAVDTIAAWLKAEDYTVFVPEASFGVRRLGYGGRVDLLVKRRNGDAAILDFKTCDIAKIRQPYENWGWQLAAYKAGLGLKAPDRLVSVPVDRGTGETKFMEWPLVEHAANLAVFSNAFEIWCARKAYDPRKWVGGAS